MLHPRTLQASAEGAFRVSALSYFDYNLPYQDTSQGNASGTASFVDLQNNYPKNRAVAYRLEQGYTKDTSKMAPSVKQRKIAILGSRSVGMLDHIQRQNVGPIH